MFCVIAAHAQLTPERTQISIGKVEEQVHELYFPFVFTNTGDRKEFVLKVEPSGTYIHYAKPKTAIQPGFSDTLKVYFDPQSKGSFNEDIVVYVSSSTAPLHLNINGTLMSVSASDDIPCYDFRHNHAPKYLLNKAIHCYVLDSATHQPLKRATVSVNSLRGLKGVLQTDRRGGIVLQISPDQYYFHALAAGYRPKRKDIYLNHRSTDVYIYLASTKENFAPIKKLDNTLAEEKDSIAPPEEIAQRPFIKALPKGDTLALDDTAAAPAIYKGELDPELYKANNIVFVIDVSGSMGLQHKMDYLKTAMITMAGQLRSFDKITLVYFSSDARVVLPTTFATDTVKIDSIIKDIKIGGTTSANKALLKAHDVVMKEHVAEANNQVILATDGIFSCDNRVISLYKTPDQPVQFTIVGLATDRESEHNLHKLSGELNGDFVNVFKQKEIRRTLLDEIKKRSAVDEVK